MSAWVVLALVLNTPWSASLQAQENIEKKLKAAYLINIMSFVRWQDEDRDAVICLDPRSAVTPYVLAEDGRALGGERLLRTLTAWSSLAQCDVLFVDNDAQSESYKPLLREHERSLLTVSDRKGALDEGFAVQFYMRNLKLRFAMNSDVVKRAEYRISSKLQRLSRQVD